MVRRYEEADAVALDSDPVMGRGGRAHPARMVAEIMYKAVEIRLASLDNTLIVGSKRASNVQ